VVAVAVAVVVVLLLILNQYHLIFVVLEYEMYQIVHYVSQLSVEN
jgi:hypothetical protein